MGITYELRGMVDHSRHAIQPSYGSVLTETHQEVWTLPRIETCKAGLCLQGIRMWLPSFGFKQMTAPEVLAIVRLHAINSAVGWLSMQQS